MPIHRLQERPDRPGRIVDITCDSDGRIPWFQGEDGVQPTISLHSLQKAEGSEEGVPGLPEPYYLGIFLTGAYQETLGDLHNLFGDTDAVHVRLDDEGGYSIKHYVEGDAVTEVLSYVQYEKRALSERVRKTIERSLRQGHISLEDSARLRRRYDQGLADYTYLSNDD